MAAMKPGKLATSAAWLSSMLAELSMTNRKSTLVQPGSALLVVVLPPPRSNLGGPPVLEPESPVVGSDVDPSVADAEVIVTPSPVLALVLADPPPLSPQAARQNNI